MDNTAGRITAAASSFKDEALARIEARLNRIEDELFDMAQRNVKIVRQLYGNLSATEEPTRRSVVGELAYRLDERRREKLNYERDSLMLAHAIIAENRNL